MKNIVIAFTIIGLCIFIGCLGVNGSRSTSSGSIVSDALLSGRIYFADKQLYGDIPIAIRNALGETVKTLSTDAGGYFAVVDIEPGIYNIAAITGDSEVVFARNIQITPESPKIIEDTSLLAIRDIIISQISSSSFHLKFHSNRSARSTIEYGTLGGAQSMVTIGQSGVTTHQITLANLRSLNDYEITVYMTGDDGQDFTAHGLYASTTGAAGPTNLSVSIEEGLYETTSVNVDTNLSADNCTHVRISETYDMTESAWVSYSTTKTYIFLNSSAGTKRIFVQFRDANGMVSPIQSDSILMIRTGYVGIWIEDGAAFTNKTEVILKAVFPTAEKMRISNNPEFSNSYWEPYIEKKNWRFIEGDGMKTIYCQFKGGKANEDDVFIASIVLDTVAPEVTLKINGGATVTATTTAIIDFAFSVPPSYMKLSNTTAPSVESEWLPFKTPIDWILPPEDGRKEVFALFKDTADNEYGPISAIIALDNTPPAGNSIAIRLTEEATSNVVSSLLVASLPVFLHFDIADTSTFSAEYTITIATTTRPTDGFTSISSPFIPVLLDIDKLPVGTHKIWARFIDEAGNNSFLQTAGVVIYGSQVIITPNTARLTSGEEQQFTAEIKNISPQDFGATKWRIISGPGTITDNGLYTAPAPILESKPTTIIAESSLNSEIYSKAIINLETSIEMLFKHLDGSFKYDEIEDQIGPGRTFDVAIKILHSEQSFEVIAYPSVGAVSISEATEADYGTIATLSYSAPASIPSTNPVIIGIRAIESPESVVGSVTILISDGPNLILSPTSGEAQRSKPLTLSARVSDSSRNTITWKVDTPGLGSFIEGDLTAITTSTTGTEHSVTFYASSTTTIQSAFVTASIAGVIKSCEIAIYPPIKFIIQPATANALPIIEPIKFEIPGFDYITGNTSEEVKWEFKNSAKSDFMPADGKTYLDRGSLSITENTIVEYRRPSTLPSLSGDKPANDIIIIKATSLADPISSATAEITISPKVEIKIFNSLEDLEGDKNPVTETSTVAEVGKLRFYAKVTPIEIGDTSVTWSVIGSADPGTIDGEGLYSAPDVINTEYATIRATSKYDQTTYTDIKVNLHNFWLSSQNNMSDEDTNEAMAITSLLVNPYTKAGNPFVIYAGTNQYGVWAATYSDVAGDNSGGNWQPILNLSAKAKNPIEEFRINHLAISSKGDVYAATNNGIWHIPNLNDLGLGAKQIEKEDGTELPHEVFNNITFNTTGDEMFASTKNGVYRIDMSTPGNKYTYKSITQIIYSIARYKDPIESRENTTASPTVVVYAYPNTWIDNPIGGEVKAIAYHPSGTLFAGVKNGKFVSMEYTTGAYTPNLLWTHSDHFISDPPSVAVTKGKFLLLNESYQPFISNISRSPTTLALDPINQDTLWVATSNGVYRSIDSGTSWTLKGFGGGSSSVNTRTVIVDSTNTINVMAGSEDGVYRSTDAGTTWKRIRSGLDEHKTVTSLSQAAGRAGARRKVWVGTAGGVFIGRQSLDLE